MTTKEEQRSAVYWIGTLLLLTILGVFWGHEYIATFPDIIKEIAGAAIVLLSFIGFHIHQKERNN